MLWLPQVKRWQIPLRPLGAQRVSAITLGFTSNPEMGRSWGRPLPEVGGLLREPQGQKPQQGCWLVGQVTGGPMGCESRLCHTK